MARTSRREPTTVDREEHGFTSTRVARAWFDGVNRLLEVWFVDGTRWEYRNVPDRVWEAFKRAPSPGAFVTETLDSYRNGPAPG